jgi:cytoskeleton protein RodZ
VLATAVLLLGALLFWFAPPMRTLFSAVGTGAAASAEDAASQAGAVAASGVDLVVATASAVPAAAASAAAAVLPSSAPVLGLQVVAGMASAVVDTVHSAPPEEPAASAQKAAAAGPVLLRTSAESWVEVRDAGGAVLLSRMLLPGEVVGLDGAMPMKLKIGNADGTRVSLRGQPVELQPFTRDNVARLDLK